MPDHRGGGGGTGRGGLGQAADRSLALRRRGGADAAACRFGAARPLSLALRAALLPPGHPRRRGLLRRLLRPPPGAGAVSAHAAERGDFRAAARLVRPGDRVLDVGCGDGAFAALVPQAAYQGLDLHPLRRPGGPPSWPRRSRRMRQATRRPMTWSAASRCWNMSPRRWNWLRRCSPAWRPAGCWSWPCRSIPRRSRPSPTTC